MSYETVSLAAALGELFIGGKVTIKEGNLSEEAFASNDQHRFEMFVSERQALFENIDEPNDGVSERLFLVVKDIANAVREVNKKVAEKSPDSSWFTPGIGITAKQSEEVDGTLYTILLTAEDIPFEDIQMPSEKTHFVMIKTNYNEDIYRTIENPLTAFLYDKLNLLKGGSPILIKAVLGFGLWTLRNVGIEGTLITIRNRLGRAVKHVKPNTADIKLRVGHRVLLEDETDLLSPDSSYKKQFQEKQANQRSFDKLGFAATESSNSLLNQYGRALSGEEGVFSSPYKKQFLNSPVKQLQRFQTTRPISPRSRPVVSQGNLSGTTTPKAAASLYAQQPWQPRRQTVVGGGLNVTEYEPIELAAARNPKSGTLTAIGEEARRKTVAAKSGAKPGALSPRPKATTTGATRAVSPRPTASTGALRTLSPRPTASTGALRTLSPRPTDVPSRTKSPRPGSSAVIGERIRRETVAGPKPNYIKTRGGEFVADEFRPNAAKYLDTVLPKALPKPPTGSMTRRQTDTKVLNASRPGSARAPSPITSATGAKPTRLVPPPPIPDTKKKPVVTRKP